MNSAPAAPDPVGDRPPAVIDHALRQLASSDLGRNPIKLALELNQRIVVTTLGDVLVAPNGGVSAP